MDMLVARSVPDLSAAAPGIVGLGPSRAPWGPLWGPIHRGRRAEGDGAERGASAATRPRLSVSRPDRHARTGKGDVHDLHVGPGGPTNNTPTSPKRPRAEKFPFIIIPYHTCGSSE